MTVKYIAFDGKEFNNEEECKDYEKENSAKARIEVASARHALRRLDDFCKYWLYDLESVCEKCPLTKLCDGICTEKFEDYFNKENPVGNVDIDCTIIEED